MIRPKTQAQINAARENGKKGGRPRGSGSKTGVRAINRLKDEARNEIRAEGGEWDVVAARRLRDKIREFLEYEMDNSRNTMKDRILAAGNLDKIVVDMEDRQGSPRQQAVAMNLKSDDPPKLVDLTYAESPPPSAPPAEPPIEGNGSGHLN